jgi:hypothetical protein
MGGEMGWEGTRGREQRSELEIDIVRNIVCAQSGIECVVIMCECVVIMCEVCASLCCTLLR